MKHKNSENSIQALYSILKSFKNDYSVSFIKKDGTVREMNVSPKLTVQNLKQDLSESQEKAAKTRKENNPNLIYVWDIDANGYRSVNLETTFLVTQGTVTYTFDNIPADKQKERFEKAMKDIASEAKRLNLE